MSDNEIYQFKSTTARLFEHRPRRNRFPNKNGAPESGASASKTEREEEGMLLRGKTSCIFQVRPRREG